MSTDPYTQVIEKLWTLIEADSTLAGLVKAGNRIKFTGDGQLPMKTNPTDGDWPQLMIIPVGGPANPHTSSTSSEATQRFDFSLHTGNMMVDASLFPVKWALFKVLARAVLNELGLPFVTNADMRDDGVEVFDARAEEQRGTKGWSLGLTVTVEMTFSRVSNVIQDPE